MTIELNEYIGRELEELKQDISQMAEEIKSVKRDLQVLETRLQAYISLQSVTWLSNSVAMTPIRIFFTRDVE